MKMDFKAKGTSTSRKSTAAIKNGSPASKSKPNRKLRATPIVPNFDNLIEKINEGFVALDKQMNYIYVNRRAGELLKRKPQDLIGKNYFDVYPEDKETSFGKSYLRALKTQKQIMLEDYYAPRDRWFENRIYPSADGLSIFFNDITELKRTEEAMRQSEDRFQTLANGSPVLLWVNGLEGCEFVNREYLDFLGITTETDIYGYDWSDFVHPDDREAYVSAYVRAFEKQTLFSAEFRFRRQDGEYRWMRSEATPRRAADGSFLGYVGATVDITVRRRAEEKLRQSEERFRQATDAYGALVYEVDLLSGNTAVVHGMENLTGYDPLETKLTSQWWHSLIHPDDLPAHLAQLDEHLKRGGTDVCEYRLRHRNGEWIIAEDSRLLILNEAGEAQRLIGTVIDISARKRVEQALARERELLGRLFETIPAMLTIYEPSTKLLRLNSQFERLVGWSSQEAAGISLMEECYPNEQYREQVRQFMESALPNEWMDIQMRTRAGHTLETSWSNIRLSNEMQVGIGIDITARKNIEEKLRESEERFRALVNQATAGIARSDVDSRLTFVNPRFCEMLGYSESELIGKTIWELTYADDLEENQRLFERMIAHGESYQFEKRFIQRDGSKLWTNVSVTVMRDLGGNAMGGVGVVVDISEYKRAEQALSEFARQQEALYYLADKLQRKDSPEDVFNAGMDAILSALQCDRTSILLFDDTNVMRFVAWRGLSDNYRKATEGHSPWEPDEQDPQPVCMNSVEMAELSDSLKTVLKAEGIGSLAFIPLVSDGKLMGKFMAYFNTPHVFGEGEIELSLTIARQLALGIESKQDEDALRASEERFRTLANVTPSMIWIAAPDGTITYANDQWFNYVGITPEENAKQWPQLILHPDDLERCVNEWTHALETVPNEYLIEVRNRRYDGQYRWFQTRAVPARDVSGKVRAWYGVTTDIHERKQAERRIVLLAYISEILRKTEDPNELTYAISKTVGEHLQVKRCLFNETDLENDREVVYQDYYNGVPSVAGIHKISDYSSITTAEMQAGKTVVNIDSKSDPRTSQDYERTYRPNRERSYVAIPLMRAKRWVATFWVSDDEPRPWSKEEVSLLETIAERTWIAIEKLRLNAALRESEERYRFIVENTSDGIWQIELTKPMPISLPEEEQIEWYYKHAVIRQCNLGLARMYGYASEQGVIGLPIRVIMLRDNPVNLELSRQFIRSGYRLVDAESREVNRDGQELVFLNNMVGVIEEGKLKGEWGTNRDITERKHAEEQLRRSAELDAFRLTLADALRPLNDPAEIQKEAMRLLGERLGAERVLYAEVESNGETAVIHDNYVDGVHKIVGQFRTSDFEKSSEKLRAGQIVNISDVATVPDLEEAERAAIAALGIKSSISVPLIKDGRWISTFIVHHSAPRAWDEEEIALLNETAERTSDAVERAHAERALRYSESLYRTIARSIPGGGVYIIDKDFRYLIAEGTVTEAFGLTREMLEGHTVSEIFPSEPAARMIERLQRNFAGETVSFETKHNGRVYWTQQAPLKDSMGQAIIVTLDITERKQTEEALRQSEERFAQFMQHLPGLAWIKDLQGRYVYANAAAKKAFNTSQENLYGRTDREIFPPESAAQFQKNDEQVLIDGKGVQFIETLEQRDDVLHYSLVNKFPIPGPDGNTVLIGGTAFDITDRKRAEEALRESEERFRAILRQATAGIVRKDAEGRLTFVNQAFCNMLGYTESELLGRTIWEVMHKEDIAENRRSYHRLMAEGVPFNLERRLIREDSSILWVDASVSPILDNTGKPQSAVAVEVDITARKRAEEELQQLNLELESRVEERTFELKAANEALRESRTGLQVLSQRLVQVQEEERRNLARELHDRVGQTLAALNINLVILSNQLANQPAQPIHTRLEDSMQLVTETIALVRDVMSDLWPPELDEYGLEAALQSYINQYTSRFGMKVNFDKPSASLPRLGPTVEMTLMRIVQGALTNVARHAQAQSVYLSLHLMDNTIQLTIQDDGVGMDLEGQPQRADSHGIKIMRERAEAVGGNFNVQSAPGRGTKIEVGIPIGSGSQTSVMGGTMG